MLVCLWGHLTVRYDDWCVMFAQVVTVAVDWLAVSSISHLLSLRDMNLSGTSVMIMSSHCWLKNSFCWSWNIHGSLHLICCFTANATSRSVWNVYSVILICSFNIIWSWHLVLDACVCNDQIFQLCQHFKFFNEFLYEHYIISLLTVVCYSVTVAM